MEKTNIAKSLIVKDAVFRKILSDKKLRDLLILRLNIRDSGVCAFARRKSQKRIKNIDVLNVLKEHTGWTDDDIFEKIEIE